MIRELLREAVDTFTPLTCAGCGRPGTSVCAECAAELLVPVREVSDGARELSQTGLLAWSAADYSGAVRELVVAWKNGRADVAEAIMAAARELTDRVLADPLSPFVPRAAGGATVAPAPSSAGPEIVVVPAPSGWQRRARGLLVVGDLANAVCEALAAAGRDAVVADSLRRRLEFRPAHLAGLSASARHRARKDSVHLAQPLPPGEVLFVDDVLTTGATLAACAQAVRREYPARKILGALTLAVTPPRSAV